jgi:hypothetical protein
MVVLAVTALLSGLILVYNASTRETLRLFTEKARMAQLILRAKALALSTYSDSDTPCAYGVQFVRSGRNSPRYELVSYRPADCSDRTRVDTGRDVFEVVQLSTFDLPPTLEYSTSSSTDDVTYVLFVPPDPIVLVARQDGTLIESGVGNIELKIKGRDTSAIVTVNAAGQVTF